MRKPGLREQIDKIYGEIVISLPEGSMLKSFVDDYKIALAREGKYQGKSWVYRVAESQHSLNAISKIASQEEIDFRVIKGLKEMDEVVLSYIKPEQKRVVNKTGVTKAFEKRRLITLEEIASRPFLPQDIIYSAHKQQKPEIHDFRSAGNAITLERAAAEEYGLPIKSTAAEKLDVSISQPSPAVSETKAYSIWQRLKNWHPLGENKGQAKAYRISWLGKTAIVGVLVGLIAGYVLPQSSAGGYLKIRKIAESNVMYASQFFESFTDLRDNFTRGLISQTSVGLKQKGYIENIVGTEYKKLAYSSFSPIADFKP
ncbi:hypothetical protein HYV80_01070 [Candidatus Woesearchaeota archaeon]|nr:hypothetical protein [Candidatus Woesearchaeota archaeon]